MLMVMIRHGQCSSLKEYPAAILVLLRKKTKKQMLHSPFSASSFA